MTYQTLNLSFPSTASTAYPIHIGSGLLNHRELLNEAIWQKQVCIVSNETVAPLYLERVQQHLRAEGKQVLAVQIPDGEQYKNLAQYAMVMDALMKARFGRDGVIVALGGGVVGDLTGFVSATYQRGTAFVQLPTTLLAQVDSSVGGKTGVNHPLGKNMIGAFHQPQAVIIDTDTLSTLPPREFSAGMAEVIKYGLINDLPFFEHLEANIQALMNKEADLLTQTIRHCCQNKADVVKADEREHGVRALLNLGHTFGHALESLSHYKRWKHGEAVAIGIRIAAELAVIEGKISTQDGERIKNLLLAAGLPIRIENTYSSDDIYQAMFLDKKVRAGKLRLIVFSALGNCQICSDCSEVDIRAAIDAAQ
ncbi:3-dehydroquinate synthase [Suttonella ornithocola]|uniref:3-dehydroquinate synthase n=1 Tax=Suttonella ornithocola TaxID=279832 RepID=A0A380MRV1_9GAMM|nr:3-dehydroquinate synthase [Suttonella ornithocola]SUO95018.1 3-dehydroquinate synthase [Suttonella ornithocola]